jgi:hypothetical protein
MESDKDDVILFEREYPRRAFLRKKVSLTVPLCALLIVIFVLSAFIVSIISFYSTEGTVCYTNTSEQTTSTPVFYSRSKRSPTIKKTNIPCIGFECCTTALDPNAPWNRTRLPTNVYPVEYELVLELFHLNEENDFYSGTIKILIEVQSPTYDIILHGDLLYSDATVSQRSSPDNIQIPVDCIIPFPNTQTLIIHLTQQLQVGNSYDVHIAFLRALNVHGTGLFENQFNKDQFGLQ